MPYHETNISLASLIGDNDPIHIIDNLLIRAPYPGANTQKYFVNGMPEVVVRHIPGEPEPERRGDVAAAFSQLPRYNVRSLPYVPVEHHDEVYVFTQRAHGVGLDELASPKTKLPIVRQIDTQWANMIRYNHSAGIEGFACARDIFGLSQHMYCRTAWDPSDRVRLVDLGDSASMYTDSGQLREGCFERTLINAANDIVAIENTLGRRLRVSRLALSSALHFASDHPDARNPNSPTFIAAARFAVSEMIHVDPDDDEDFYDRFTP